MKESAGEWWNVCLLIIVCVGMLFAVPARATVTSLVWYHLGEADAGALNGGPATNTIDSVSTNNLTFSSNAVYSSDVSASAAAHAASSLAVVFTNAAFATNNIVSTLVTNYGLEFWVNPASASGTQVIVYNGNTATSGWGVIIGSSNYEALFGGRRIFGNAQVTPSVWTHVALVCDTGITTLYINGVANTNLSTPPAVPTGNFGLGTHPQVPQGEFFTGLLDEVRLFTFAPGQFSTNDLLLNRASIVTTLTDDGDPGSLRSVIANALPGDTVTFATNGTITLTNGEIALTNSLNIVGPGPGNLAISGGNLSRGFNIGAGVTNTISGVTIGNGMATATLSGNGGGIYNAGWLTLSNCVITNCIAQQGPGGTSGSVSPLSLSTPGGPGADGGGIYNVGTLNLVACSLSRNHAGPGGTGAPFSFFSATAGGVGGSGGGIFNSGAANLFGCTLAANFGGDGGAGGAGNVIIPGTPPFGAGPPGPGGSCGAIYNTGNIELTLCTIDSNGVGSNGGSAMSGGIFNSGVLTLLACTITRNNGGATGGGVYNLFEATARNTLFAGNMAASAPDYYGPFSSQGRNLIGDDDGSFGFFPGTSVDLVGTSNSVIDARIGPLADNGGPTMTVALQAGSPAIDAGDDLIIGAGIATDQRGEPRKSGAHVDIGAYETLLGIAPMLSSLGMNSNQVFGVVFTNTPRAVFTILTSTNAALPLAEWTELGMPTEISPGQFQFLDGSASNSPLRFYQVRSP